MAPLAFARRGATTSLRPGGGLETILPMLRIDISTLKTAELGRLLVAARARGQHELVQSLEAEIAAREGGAPAETRASSDEPAVEDDETRPMVVPDPSPDLRLERERRRSPPRRGWPIGLAAAGVLTLGGMAAWGLSGAPGFPRLSPNPGGEPPRVATRPAPPAASPTPTPRAMTARVAPSPPSQSGPAALAPTPTAVSAPEPPRAVALAKAEAPARRRLDPCATPPTPADRLLCNDLGLNLLSHEMRDAYGRALSAGADPVAIREGQAAWRRVRDPVADPRVLAELYDRRIRELKAAASTAAASGPDAAEIPAVPAERRPN